MNEKQKVLPYVGSASSVHGLHRRCRRLPQPGGLSSLNLSHSHLSFSLSVSHLSSRAFLFLFYYFISIVGKHIWSDFLILWIKIHLYHRKRVLVFSFSYQSLSDFRTLKITCFLSFRNWIKKTEVVFERVLKHDFVRGFSLKIVFGNGVGNMI